MTTVTEPDAPTTTPYDAVPYPRWTGHITHPNRLAVLATLFGLSPPDVKKARVLELATASAANLIPMAYSLPEASFTGIDLSSVQIAEGKRQVAELGLTNIRLEQKNILDITPDFGEFDFIVAHGVYSWVPPAVQDKILEICAKNLSPHGLCYISYNTLPGWRSIQIVRDLMLWHIRDIRDPQERIKQARAVLKFQIQSMAARESPHAKVLQEHFELFEPRTDSYLYHELLADFNAPEHFSDFARRAAQQGLQYLCEAVLREGGEDAVNPNVLDSLASVGDRIVYEQYLDFLILRRFRRSILCKAGAVPAPKPRPEKIPQFKIVCSSRPVSPQPDLASPNVEHFTTGIGSKVAATNPIDKAALVILAEEAPRGIAFEELVDLARARVRTPEELANPISRSTDVARLCDSLLLLFGGNAVDLEVFDCRAKTVLGSRPKASPIAQLEGVENGAVSNLRHQAVKLKDPVTRQLFPALDGTRDLDGLVDYLVGRVRSGNLKVEESGKPLEDQELLRGVLRQQMLVSLNEILRMGLLVE